MRMKWVIVFFAALVAIPAAQVGADAWRGRAGPNFLLTPEQQDGGTKLVITKQRRHHQRQLGDPDARRPAAREKIG
jgi:hypothetical protein